MLISLSENKFAEQRCTLVETQGKEGGGGPLKFFDKSFLEVGLYFGS